MLGPLLLLTPKYRGMWLLLAGGSWILLFIYGTLKFLFLGEWGYACVTGGVVCLAPLGVALGLRGRLGEALRAHYERRRPAPSQVSPTPGE